MTDWVIRGEVEYYGDRVELNGEMAEDARDVIQYIDENLKDIMLRARTLVDTPERARSVDIEKVLNHFYRNADKDSREWKILFGDPSLANYGYVTHGVLYRLGCCPPGGNDLITMSRRSVYANSDLLFRGLRHDSNEFKVTTYIPLPPKVIHKALKGYQGLGRMLRLLGDSRPDWVQKPFGGNSRGDNW